jgi:hypothetical protein
MHSYVYTLIHSPHIYHQLTSLTAYAHTHTYTHTHTHTHTLTHTRQVLLICNGEAGHHRVAQPRFPPTEHGRVQCRAGDHCALRVPSGARQSLQPLHSNVHSTTRSLAHSYALAHLLRTTPSSHACTLQSVHPNVHNATRPLATRPTTYAAECRHPVQSPHPNVHSTFYPPAHSSAHLPPTPPPPSAAMQLLATRPARLPIHPIHLVMDTAAAPSTTARALIPM